MQLNIIGDPEPRVKFSFSGHESFQCRQLWLKKGYDYIKKKKSFGSEEAVVDLGVGKNMVTSIKYWLKAFNLVNSNDTINDLADRLLGENGFDPFLEDDASLWLLHYYLVKTGFASTYSIIFNELRREKIEFNRESYVAYIKRKAETEQGLFFNANTVGDDFDVFRKMYLSSNDDSKNIEDSFSGLLTDLGLIKSIEKTIEENGKKRKIELLSIENTLRPSLPVRIFLYSILANRAYGFSVSLRSLEHDPNGPGLVFALSREGLLAKIKEAVEEEEYITYIDQAGVKELQFLKEYRPEEMLKKYYAK